MSDKIDFVISAPYADKLPLKVAELIRKDIPFAVLLPLSLLDEIDRTGKTSIDEVVRQKRLDMELVIVTSLGEGWLINHPECRLSNSTHAVFKETAKGSSVFQLRLLQLDRRETRTYTTYGTNEHKRARS
jgi:hypothetical protein